MIGWHVTSQALAQRIRDEGLRCNMQPTFSYHIWVQEMHALYGQIHPVYVSVGQLPIDSLIREIAVRHMVEQEELACIQLDLTGIELNIDVQMAEAYIHGMDIDIDVSFDPACPNSDTARIAAAIRQVRGSSEHDFELAMLNHPAVRDLVIAHTRTATVKHDLPVERIQDVMSVAAARQLERDVAA